MAIRCGVCGTEVTLELVDQDKEILVEVCGLCKFRFIRGLTMTREQAVAIFLDVQRQAKGGDITQKQPD